MFPYITWHYVVAILYQLVVSSWVLFQFRASHCSRWNVMNSWSNIVKEASGSDPIFVPNFKALVHDVSSWNHVQLSIKSRWIIGNFMTTSCERHVEIHNGLFPQWHVLELMRIRWMCRTYWAVLDLLKVCRRVAVSGFREPLSMLHLQIGFSLLEILPRVRVAVSR
jgi:hypothetical protein